MSFGENPIFDDITRIDGNSSSLTNLNFVDNPNKKQDNGQEVATVFPVPEPGKVEVRDLVSNGENLDFEKFRVDKASFDKDVSSTKGWEEQGDDIVDDNKGEKSRREEAKRTFEEKLKNGEINSTEQIISVLDSIGGNRLDAFKPIYDRIEQKLNSSNKLKNLTPAQKENFKVQIISEMLKEGKATDVLYSIMGGFKDSVDKKVTIKTEDLEKSGYNNRMEMLNSYIDNFCDKKLETLDISSLGENVDADLLKSLRERLEIHDIKILGGNGSKILESVINNSQGTQENLVNIMKDGQGAFRELSFAAPEIIKGLLKIPILGSILAGFLGLDSKDPAAHLDTLVENNKLLKDLKGLGIQKDKNGKIINNGTAPFEGVDFSQITTTNELHPYLQTITAWRSGRSSEKKSDFWKNAFNGGAEILDKGAKIGFKLDKSELKDGIVTPEKFQEILKLGIDNVNANTEKKKQDEDKAKQETEKKAEQMKDIEILVKSLEILRGNGQVFDTLNGREQFSYYDKFKKIKLEDLKKNFASNDSGIGFAIKGFKEDISGDSKLYFTKSINIIMDYLKTEDTTGIETIGALMESPYFKHYLVIKIDTELTQLKTKPAPTPV